MRILLIIGIILLILWLAGFILVPVLGWLIHITLVIAVILLIIWLLRAVFKLFKQSLFLAGERIDLKVDDDILCLQ